MIVPASTVLGLSAVLFGIGVFGFLARRNIILMLVSLAFFIIGFTMGGLNYVVTVLQARTRTQPQVPAREKVSMAGASA